MATSGPVGDEFDVQVTLDREVDDDHSVRLVAHESFRFMVGGMPYGELTLAFDETNWGIPQDVTVVGEYVGTYPMKCICTSTYYQQLGILKEELSEVELTFSDANVDGWKGSIAGLTKAPPSGQSIEDVSVTGSLWLRYTNTSTKTMYIKKTTSFGNDIVAMKVTKPNGAIVWTRTSGTGSHLNHLMDQVGVYRFDVYEQIASSGIPSNTIGSGTWDAKITSSSNPPIHTTSVLVNGIIYRKDTVYPNPFGPANIFTAKFGEIIQQNLCSPGSRVGHTDSKYAFTGSATVSGTMEATATGYYTSNIGYIKLRSTGSNNPITIGGKGFIVGTSGWEVDLSYM